ncbi:sulfite oxidase heme-binding subunit YedZ [Prosthecomicrobium sp. N25]|uniref:sulfite oxidase heme-binding subunit YedZ n=1 Tax=Prosthecomicrobium sp. N25 TaxID=3129254 RepID=UPI003076B35D
MAPWYDRSGRFSVLKAAALACALLPALWLALRWQQGWLGARPLNEAIHQAGLWSIRFLLATLAVTPLRHIGGWTKLISIRRILGVTALAYGLLHLVLYAGDQAFDLAKIASEIVLRTYLTIGFLALCAMAAMGATSTDAAIRRLGAARWRRLHALIHPVAVLAVLHFFMQSKIDASEAALMLGFLVLLELYRVLIRRRIALTFVPLAATAAVAGLATALLEAGWYAAATKVPPDAVLEANLYLDLAVRPAWWVLGVGLSAALLGRATPRAEADARRPARAAV